MPPKKEALEQSASLMLSFAERTGLTSSRPKQRYLWTDAFAVCTFLGLARMTGEQRFATLALDLVVQVHHVLGRHREDDPRAGWLSGLGEQEGAAHPTRGGLRIGKKLPERRAGEPFDESLEWDRDGQYFHYLTKWMHALDVVSRSTGDPRFNTWATELAEAAHAAFVYEPRGSDGGRRMFWKMSIDLSRPLIPSMGQHDPLDGLVTFTQLDAPDDGHPAPSLRPAIRELATMVERTDLRTADPLGLGGLLSDAGRVATLMGSGAFPGSRLLPTLLQAAEEGLSRYSSRGELRLPASRRLAFRELGLAIGLSAIELIHEQASTGQESVAERERVGALLRALSSHAALGTAIESFWREPAHRETTTWSDHRDINDVMLAACLAPEGYLALPAWPRRRA